MNAVSHNGVRPKKSFNETLKMSAPTQFDIDLQDFVQFLQLVRSLSHNTISAYRSDLVHFFEFLKDPESFQIRLPKVPDPRYATPEHLTKFLRIGYDNDLYIQTQSEHIRKRIAKFGGKLYLEFGGKLYDDFHASRVLPGFAPDSKLNMLMQLKDQAEFVTDTVLNDGIEKALEYFQLL